MIYVVAHKEYDIYHSNIYQTIWVGKQQNMLMRKYGAGLCDDTGDNISYKNSCYNEMTALYWIWKNTNDDITGLCHYRRYFYCPFHDGFFKTPLSKWYIKKYLMSYDIILQKKADYKELTLKEHYIANLPEAGFNICREKLSLYDPDCLCSFDEVMKWHGMHSCNMFISKRKLVEDYCEWVFPLLKEIDAAIDYTGWNDYEKRTPGMLAELLLNVFVYCKGIRIKELPFGDRRTNSYISYLKGHFANKKNERIDFTE